MLTHLELTRPDGTPLGDDEIPAAGTILVLELDDVTTALAHLPYTAAITARVLGWVPGPVDRMDKSLLTGACVALNKRGNALQAEESAHDHD